MGEEFLYSDEYQRQKEFGAFLSSERERQGITLEQVAERICVSVRKIRALEAGEFEQLPKMPFLGGIVQAYGKCVGSDVEDLIVRLKETGPSIYPILDLENVHKPQDSALTHVDKASFYVTKRLVLTVLSVVVVLSCVWFGLDYVSAVLDEGQKRPQALKKAVSRDVSSKTPVKSTKSVRKKAVVATKVKKDGKDVLVIESEVPNFVKFLPKAELNKNAKAVFGGFVGPGHPFRVKDVDVNQGMIWGLYPFGLKVVVHDTPWEPEWKDRLATIEKKDSQTF